MSANSKDESTCKSCSELRKLVGDQKEKMQIIEKRLRDLVKAYKLVSYERDSLLACNEVRQQFTSKDDEQRLSLLENNVAELSKLCGNYENDRVRYEKTIDKLTMECEELRSQLQQREDMSTEEASVASNMQAVVSRRNEFTQTELLEEIDEECTQVPKECTVPQYHDVSTQTVSESSVEGAAMSSTGKKSELAIVLPTHREPVRTESPTRRQSINSPSSLVSLEEVYPTNYTPSAREQRNSSGTMFSLFYTTELARKEIELNDIKLRAREAECTLRELQWRYNIDIYKLESRVSELEKQKSQLQSDSGFQPNLTYVRNVLLRFISTQDKQQKQCMINALLTALKIQENEGKP